MSLTLAIAAPVRSEAAYLLEWIAFHRALGIQKFFLADNDGEDGTSELLRALDRRQLVRRLDWIGQRYFQLAFYQQAIELARGSVDGLFLIDVDEFLHPESEATSLHDVAQSWLSDENIGAVAINWAIYGSSGEAQKRDGLVIERFKRRAAQDFSVNRHIKSFVRVEWCRGPTGNPHAVALSRGRYADTRGQPVGWDQTHVPAGITENVVWDRLRVDHFVLKSRAEFERKLVRGSAMARQSEQQRRNHAYFSLHDRNEIEDPMPPALVERTKSELRCIAPLVTATRLDERSDVR